jgi:hypothetical protein
MDFEDRPPMHLFGFLGLLFGLIGADAPSTRRAMPDESAVVVAPESAPPSSHLRDLPCEPEDLPADDGPEPTHPEEWQPEPESKDGGDTGLAFGELFAIEAGPAGSGGRARGDLSSSRLRSPFLVARRC